MKLSFVPSATYCATFYTLHKVRRTNIPLRPIVSNNGTITYPVAKSLASFSTLCYNNTHTVNTVPKQCSMLVDVTD